MLITLALIMIFDKRSLMCTNFGRVYVMYFESRTSIRTDQQQCPAISLNSLERVLSLQQKLSNCFNVTQTSVDKQNQHLKLSTFIQVTHWHIGKLAELAELT